MKAALLGLILLVPFTLCADIVRAQEESSILFVAPSRITMKPDENITEINVSNKSSEARRYDLAIVDQVMNEEGMTQRVETFDYSAKRLLKFVPKRFTLKSGERQVIRVMATRTADMSDGDYHSHLLFREVPLAMQDKAAVEEERKNQTAAQFEIKALYGVAIPIIVQKGQVASDISIGEVSYIPASDGAPPHIAVELLRSGNAEASTKLNIRLDKGGESIPVIKEQWVPIYREVGKVTRRFPLTELPAGTSLKGGKILLELVKDNMKNPDGTPAMVTKEVMF